MPTALVPVSLVPAPDDHRFVNGALQAIFGNHKRFLHISGLEVLSPMYYHDANVEGGYLGEFIIPLAQATQLPLTTVVTVWLGGRAGRTVRLSIREGQAEARNGGGRELSRGRAQQPLEATAKSNEP